MADCNFPLCTRIAQRNGLCLNHRIYADSFPSAIIAEEMERKEKKQKPIPKVAEKRKVLNRELAKIVARIKKERPVCEMKVPGVCTGRTVTAHHPKGKIGELLLDESQMIASCSPCNLWCETNDAEARAKGFKKQQHGIYNRKKV